MNNGVTIGQAAVFAGVTIKTVRHYEKNGLLDEPARDSSGYRRYGSVQHAIEDPQFLAVYRNAAEALTWEPDDPRIDDVATAVAGHYLANPAHLEIVTGLQARTEAATRYTLIRHHGEEPQSTAARMTALVEAKLRAAGVRIPGANGR
ncbi:MerR family DNA-binding transcriptional regulator [Nocardia sp. NPDC058658]|uniref:MerR family DNA-binding transcriptional regulator n=1 Tax=Nocardia sp. NPDC058658 TaxID=3346580 RepID=UPI00366694C0